MSFQIHLTRWHSNGIAIGAADTAGDPKRDDGPIRFDGGRNTRTPTDFVALYGEQGDGGSAFYALVVREAWIQDPGRACRVLLKNPHHPDLALEGCYLAESAMRLVVEREEMWESWEEAEESAVPAFVLPILNKVIMTLQGLFGQGGDFFQISLAPPEEAPKPTAAPTRRRGTSGPE